MGNPKYLSVSLFLCYFCYLSHKTFVSDDTVLYLVTHSKSNYAAMLLKVKIFESDQDLNISQ